MKNILVVFFFTLSIFMMSSCQDKCESCNTTADFTISEGNLNLGEYNEWDEADTVGLLWDVKFEAICDDMTRYEWTIGTDQRVFTEPSFTLYFGVKGTIDIKLKVYKDEDPNCPDNTVRVDSMTKKLIVIDNEITYIEGVYRGYNTSEPDLEFDVEVEFDSTQSIVGAYVIYNLPAGCHTKDSPFRPTRLGSFRKRFYMSYHDSSPECDRPKGWGRLQDDLNTLIIDYSIRNYDSDSGELEAHQFIGRRIR